MGVSLKSPQTIRRVRVAPTTCAMLSTCAARSTLFSRKRVTILRILVSRAVSERNWWLVMNWLSEALMAVERRWLLKIRTVSSPTITSAQTEDEGVSTVSERRMRYLLRMVSVDP